jgi:hypothetical protein
LIYLWEHQGRRATVLVAIAALWLVALVLWLAFSVAVFVTVILIGVSLPLIWEAVRNTKTRLEVWPSRVVWASALRDGDRSDIDHVRLDRRFDGGLKITLIHVGGAHTRLPPDVTPPADALEAALKEAGIAAQRHPFSPF